MDKYYLLVTFGEELESDGNGNEGRRMILKDISGENTYYYGQYGPPSRELILFKEEVIEAIKNKLKVYSQESEQSDFILDYDIMDDYFIDQWDGFIYFQIVNNDVPIITSYDRGAVHQEVYLILDPSEAPKQEENKVLRTLATGQSDITRHDAYTKAQGLNWSNANVPQYSAAQITIKSLGKDTKLFIAGKNEQTDGETNLLKFLCNFYQEAIEVDTSAGFDVVNLPVVYEHPYNSVDRIDNPAVIVDENGTRYYGIFEINTQTNSVHININVVNGGGEMPSTIFVKEVQFYMTESENADAEGTPVGNVVGYDLQLSIEGPLK